MTGGLKDDNAGVAYKALRRRKTDEAVLDRLLRNNRKANIPIVAMTANAFEEDKKKAFKASMNAHIAKPIDINTILAVFDQVFGV